jgi:hypothetical protein
MEKSKIRLDLNILPGSFLLSGILLAPDWSGSLLYNAFLSSNHIHPWFGFPKAASILTIPLIIFLAANLIRFAVSWHVEWQIQEKMTTKGSQASTKLWSGNLEKTMLSQKILSGCA